MTQLKDIDKDKKESYSLKVGQEGAPRLTALNEMCNPLTLSFIEQHIDLKNKSILDVGCGIGILSAQLAKRSLPNGHVLGIDLSQAQLDMALSLAKKNNIHNMTFQKISALEIDSLNKTFDFIYCRFVLAHLSQYSEIIEKLTHLMHPNSVLICEEPNNVASLSCYPTSSVFEQFKKAAIQQVDMSGADFSVGKKLSDIFKKNHLRVLQVQTQKPLLNTVALKNQLWQGVEEIESLLIKSEFATPLQIKALIEALKAFAKDTHQVAYWEYTQIAAVTPLYQSQHTLSAKKDTVLPLTPNTPICRL